MTVDRKKPARKRSGAPRTVFRWGFRGKTVWDLLQLLVIPLVLVGIGVVFDARQQSIEERRAESQARIEEQRAQDAALQAYLDQMSHLLLEKDLRSAQEDSEVRTLARARTLTVLGTLEPERKREVMLFLIEAELVQGAEEQEPIIGLNGANLYRAILAGTDLRGADLRGAILAGASLREADLFGADLRDAALPCSFRNFRDRVCADLQDANLRDVNLRGAILDGADLSGANLSGADLSGTRGLTKKQLESTGSLEGATLPPEFQGEASNLD